MSTIKKRFSLAVIFCAEILLLALTLFAQDLEINIGVNSLSPADIQVDGKFLKKNPSSVNKNWSFVNSAAAAENLGERVSDLRLSDRQNKTVPTKKFASGEYVAEGEANAWAYSLNAKPVSNITTAAHVSSVKDEQGILMFDDLLPQFSAEDKKPISARVSFELPDGWKIISREKVLSENVFAVENIEKAIFLVGKNWREEEITNGKSFIKLAISGEWQFSDAEASEMASRIFEEYQKLFGEIPAEKIQITFARFPKETKPGRWEAETRGANVTIFSSDMPFKTQSAQRLHEQLRHELFHLWMPNNLALNGNYDWFYEGFTVYQALRTGVATKQIRFEDFLDTISQAYNLDNSQTGRVSLIEAAKNRRSGTNKQVYARGMVVAFLCDAALLRQSGGKRSITDVFQEVYRKHRKPNEAKDGNAAILNVLKNYAELQTVVEKYISGAEKINWQADLESVGIKASETDSVVKLAVKAKLSGKQKDLLNELGYNNWRKILGK